MGQGNSGVIIYSELQPLQERNTSIAQNASNTELDMGMADKRMCEKGHPPNIPASIIMLVVVACGSNENINLSYTILLFNINFKLSLMYREVCKYKCFK
jgi:hypothetical protein